ncbi:uncharacterized protein LOC127643140 [Xyrauchen texanus]|uniref:uncharacterized protein LOC127643140 n=1 Tax=Xyrauchen texanus TaxID=154827 RepID=UPI0022427372|nr:uncharacterized protein LOC127643140 [Xyrauchen texanus]XP_051981690.1 uncharacterized protein LOC127643140 [Xyrauchen texanus]
MKIRSLKSQVCKLKTKVRKQNRLKKTSMAGVNKKSVMKQLKKLLPAKAYAFVSTQIRMSQRKALGFWWTTHDKAFFLALLHASPKCYRLLFKVFSMPSVRTLQKLMKSTDLKPGFKQSILATIKNNSEKTSCELVLQFRAYASQESPQVIIDTDQISDEHRYTSQYSPRITISSEIIDEHSYARVTTDCGEAETGSVRGICRSSCHC